MAKQQLYGHNGYRKFADVQEQQIVNAYLMGFTLQSIADEFHSSQTCIGNILRRRGCKTRSKEKLSKEAVEELISDYVSKKMTIDQVAKKYSVSYECARETLKRNHIKRRPLSIAHRKYTLNEHAFDKVDTDRKAYTLGLLYADGTNDGRRVRIALISIDKKILEEIKCVFGTNQPLLVQNRMKEHSTWNNLCHLEISNKYLAQKLITHGLIPRKAHRLEFPNIEERLKRHFIRGYYDGDGSLTIRWRGPENRYPAAYLTIIGSEKFLTQIQNVIKSLMIQSTISDCSIKNGNTKRITISGVRNVKHLLDWMYKGSNLKIDRKYKNYLKICKIYGSMISNPSGH